MTWFRCGGIPVTLKNAMNSVLNKKFGTSTTYDASGWPDDVNLMGPLPVKTASGAIASFDDGADGVPVKSCVVSFLPSGGGGTPSAPVAIQGVSGLSVTRVGANCWDEQVEIGGLNTTTGQDSALSDRIRSKNYIPVKPNITYYVYNGTDIASSSNINTVWLCYGADKTYLGSYYYKNKTQPNLVTPNDCYYVRFYAVNTYGTTYNNDIALNYPSTVTTYAHYSAETITDTFGQTIYGGTRDLTTDKASVDMTKDTMTYSYLSGLPSSYIGYVSSVPAMSNHPAIWVRNWNYSQMPTIKAGGIKCATNAFPDIRINDSNIISTQYRVYFDVTECNISSVQDFLDAIQTMEQGGNSLEVAYELATPTEITGLTPHEIDTLYGDNNIYADTGTTEVEYRADIDLALNALQGSRSLSASLMRSESLEEVSEPEEIIQNTEEQEGENDER